MIDVEVAYATPKKQFLRKVTLPEPVTIEQAIRASGVLEVFSEIDIDKVKVGVFSHQKQLQDRLEQGDRVEIYRPLTIDPKEARRRRAE
ncbi:MAG: RnfH family protein [Gammaproteobacteria bacterium]